MTIALDEAAKGNYDRATGPAAAVSQLVLREISALKELSTQRMDSFQRAIDVAHADFNQLPTDLEKAIAGLEELVNAKMAIHQEMFDGIKRQLVDRDARAIFQHSVAEKALHTALESANEMVVKQQLCSDKAIDKSEAAFTKLLDKQAEMIQAVKAGLEAGNADVKDRLTRIESMAVGKIETTKDSRESMGVWIGIGGLLVGFLSFIGMVAAMILPRL